MTKHQLKTVRFTPEEGRVIERYLGRNQIFESFSALARVATLHFISRAEDIALNPVSEREEQRPAFLWDYELSEGQVREILGSRGLSPKKRWLLGRILTQARLETVRAYVDLKLLPKFLPLLPLSPLLKKRWAYALTRWSLHAT